MARIGVADHDPPRSVRFVGDVCAVDGDAFTGDAFVGVVVGVQERVPQAQVPERACRRGAVDDQRLTMLELIGTHRVGGVSGRPPVGVLGHRVGLGDLVRWGYPGRDEGALFIDPGPGGPQPAGEVLPAVLAAARRADRLNAPLRPPVGIGVVQVVPSQCDDGVGVEGEARLPSQWPGGEDELEVPVGVEQQRAVVEGADDPIAVVAVVRTAVDRDRQVHRVPAVPAHPVTAMRVDGRELIERVRVVPTPLLVRADDVDEAGIVLIAPHVGIDRHPQQAERQPITVEQICFLQGRIRRQKLRFDGREFGEQPMERLREFVVSHALHSFRYVGANGMWWCTAVLRFSDRGPKSLAATTGCP